MDHADLVALVAMTSLAVVVEQAAAIHYPTLYKHILSSPSKIIN